jgi:1-acyl-sn-glycerol-3-phosphate acyltransferase
MRSQAGPDQACEPVRTAALGDALRLYLGLASFAVMCVVTSVAMMMGGGLATRKLRRHFARAMVSRMFRGYLRSMERLGALRLDLDALDALAGAPPMVIAPNHPSMIDAGLMLSRMPDLTCIMKEEILHSLLFGAGARMAGYITNDPPRAMLRAAVDSLHAGDHLLLFPEGTRTQAAPLNALQRTVGVIARRASVPVQAVIIETNTAFLGKGWPLSRIPLMPMVYRVRLGKRFDPPADVDAFTAELDTYFHAELAASRPPVSPP